MLFSKYVNSLSRFHKIDFTSKVQLTLLLCERHSYALFDHVIRFGIYERGLLEDIYRELRLPCRENDDAPVIRAQQPRCNEARSLVKTPRDIYVNDVMPNVEKRCARLANSKRTQPIPPLEATHADEMAFAILDYLQAKCALAAIESQPKIDAGTCMNTQTERNNAGSENTPIDLARKTATLAAQLFGRPVNPKMIDDWGQERSNLSTTASLSISKPLGDCLRMLFHQAAQDLRLTFAEDEKEMGDLAIDVWHAHDIIFSNPESQLSHLSPTWWMRPTYRLPRYFDELGISSKRVLIPFENFEEHNKAYGGDTIHLLLNSSSARGLAAICGMALARATLSDNPSYVGRRLRAADGFVSLSELAQLHARLLGIANLL